MRYTAQDGKTFATVQQGRKYDMDLSDKARERLQNAPGGPAHEHAVRMHGIPRKYTIELEGPGRWRLTTHHPNGQTFTQVHPELFRAMDVAKQMGGAEPPPALDTHRRARSQPTGPKERERIDDEDQRESDEGMEEF